MARLARPGPSERNNVATNLIIFYARRIFRLFLLYSVIQYLFIFLHFDLLKNYKLEISIVGLSDYR